MKSNRTYTSRNRDYSDKITYWQNQLNKSINCAPIDLSSTKIEKALKSLTYFTQKQIEIVKEKEYEAVLRCW